MKGLPVGQLSAPNLGPLVKPLRHYLRVCDRTICVACTADLLTALRQRLGIPVTCVDSATDVAEIDIGAQSLCLLVSADVFDAEASGRLAETRQRVGRRDTAFIFAVTTFMPGAYRQFTQMSGADDCISESSVLLDMGWSD